MIKKFRIFEIDGSELRSYTPRKPYGINFDSKEAAEEYLKTLNMRDMLGRINLIILEVWTNV